MADIKTRLISIKKMLGRLETVLNKLNNVRLAKMDPDDIMTHRESLVKVFEICFDLFWKLLKSYLALVYAVDVASPKKVFQEAFKQKIASQPEADLLIKMAEDRNISAHVYDEESIEKLSYQLSEYQKLMTSILQKLSWPSDVA